MLGSFGGDAAFRIRHALQLRQRFQAGFARMLILRKGNVIAFR
ncbi:MAG: hypothetical protein ACXVG9_05120 [Terriglobales bacterium]